jgi:hypothetical protein
MRAPQIAAAEDDSIEMLALMKALRIAVRKAMAA